jgi:glycosyltransferase involved in cell wall biosynthesis
MGVRYLKYKPTMIIFIEYYLPGYKSGGPVRSISNFVENLSNDFEFLIITKDRDARDEKQYQDIIANEWNSNGNSKVFYVSPNNINFIFFVKLLKKTNYDLIYLNSFFNFHFSILPLVIRRLYLVKSRPLILAVRGEFSSGALSLKKWKKILYLYISKFIGLYKNIIWQSSSEHESLDIRNVYKVSAKNILIAQNLSTIVLDKSFIANKCLNKPLKILFLSRISKMKNLDYALLVLKNVTIPVIFNIFGPIWDDIYWDECNRIIDELPDHIEVNYKGSVEPKEISRIMLLHDLLFLPSKGENFGQVIAESFAAGTAVLISNNTPWKNLQVEGVGWDYDLSNPTLFKECIEMFSQLSDDDFRIQSNRIIDYAGKKINSETVIFQNINLFKFALKYS